MHPDKFGDSYDIVKQSILRWLRPCGTWAIHPMFTEDFSQSYSSFADEYGEFLDSGILTINPVPSYSGQIPRTPVRWNAYLEERRKHFENSRQWDCADHIFLDPDTGLWLPANGMTRKPPDQPERYLIADELLDIAKECPHKLVLVFDQSFSRNLNECMRRSLTEKKLRWLNDRAVYGITYLSHANFVLVSTDKGVLDNAKLTLLAASNLPSRRLVAI